MPTRYALGSSGRFGPVPLIPRDAWLEGIVNAAVHRSYSNFGDHTRVEIFDDRIEIESPGRFPGLADPTAPLSVTRFARNPRIADPEYHQTSGSVRLTLTTSPVEGELENSLPDDTREITRLLRDAGR